MGSSVLKDKDNIRTMKLTVLITFSLVLFQLFGPIQSGCAEHGCCWCTSRQGHVIPTGSKKPRCDYGFDCECSYHPNNGYYGICTDGNGLYNNAAAAPSDDYYNYNYGK